MDEIQSYKKLKTAIEDGPYIEKDSLAASPQKTKNTFVNDNS